MTSLASPSYFNVLYIPSINYFIIIMLDSARPLTLYVNNINEKVSLNKVKPVLRRLFGRYGSVVQLTAHKNLKMKGQAFITYTDSKSCEKALTRLQGRPVFKKPIRITYAKSNSDEGLKLLGDTAAVELRKKLKKEREAANEAENEKKKQTPPATSTKITNAQLKQWRLLPPNNILLLQNLSDDKLESSYLEATFGNFAGFQKIRLIKFRKLAFIEFDNNSNATGCLEKIDYSTLGEEALLTYAKK